MWPCVFNLQFIMLIRFSDSRKRDIVTKHGCRARIIHDNPQEPDISV